MQEKSRIIPIYDVVYETFDENLAFYTALGFVITYYQKSPYRFASMKKADLGEFSFYGNKEFSEAHPSGCYIKVSHIEQMYQELKMNLQKYYGKMPVKGKPQLSRLNKTAEDRRVNITDPSGNTIIIGQPFGDSQQLMDEEANRIKSLPNRYEKLYAQAYRYIYSKEDFITGNNLITAALNQTQDNWNEEMILKGKVLKLECSIALGQVEQAQTLIQELDSFTFNQEDGQELAEIIERFENLKAD